MHLSQRQFLAIACLVSVCLAGVSCSAPSAQASLSSTAPAGKSTASNKTTSGVDLSKQAAPQVFLPSFPHADYWLLKDDGTSLPLISAHRGRPEIDHYPENCLESLAKLIAMGSFVAELDVQVSSDGVLFLFHDQELERLTLHKGLAHKRTWADLDTMRLRDPKGRLTKYTIPSLDEALTLAKGKALLSLDRRKPASLDQINKAVDKRGMLNQVSLILYNMDDYKEWAELDRLGPISYEARDQLVVEQLAQRNRELYLRFGISPYWENKTRPTSVFLGVGRPDPKLLTTAKTLGIRATVGTFGELDRQAAADGGLTYRRLIEAGVSVLATDQPILASRAIYTPKP